ncbi:hypothetical protein [Aureliella helgolandensis]|uniref:Uncharacterized protein n=1 Tax=Aureliella helgolandensis TaxID=2527968 RepID=A0A518GCA6_9BACT|nr:hypothetical protein [Aureliella helgolandensis]QDV26229.1 hypothetical protein Q31a_46010 [Aureliella helgolandensis]
MEAQAVLWLDPGATPYWLCQVYTDAVRGDIYITSKGEPVERTAAGVRAYDFNALENCTPACQAATTPMPRLHLLPTAYDPHDSWGVGELPNYYCNVEDQ